MPFDPLMQAMINATGKPPAPNSNAFRAAFQKGVPRSPELERIAYLPRRRLDLAAVPDLSPVFVHTKRCDVRPCDICRDGTADASLWPLQSAALLEAERRRGLWAPIAVGGGKTLLVLLLPRAFNARRALILVPAQTRDQLLDVDVPRLRRHFHLPLERIAAVASYETLSDRKKGAHLLDTVEPDAVICDEAHKVSNYRSARGFRFYKFLGPRGDVPFAALTGTPGELIERYCDLVEFALRTHTPVPTRRSGALEDFAAALDPDVEDRLAPGALLEAFAQCGTCGRPGFGAHEGEVWCEEHLPEGATSSDATTLARVGFQRRVAETEGVVGSSASECGANLVIRARRPEVPAEVAEALRTLSNTWCIGDEEIEDATVFSRHARTLSLGFWMRWRWPEVDGIVQKDHEWLGARRDYMRAQREFLGHRRKPGLDSPALLVEAIERGDREVSDLAPIWHAWDAVRRRWWPHPPTEAVWISDFAIGDVFTWADERRAAGENGIVWYEHIPFGDMLRRLGFPTHGAGENREVLALDPKTTPVVALSYAHATGKNLQRYSRALFAYPSSGSTKWEQAIGREHRAGQRADEVVVDVLAHLWPLEQAFHTARGRARAVWLTQGTKQKILVARLEGWKEPSTNG